uniref:Uncharacterized protein n=1 Tax=Oryza nivara TaxID=4536 RepID=A0A0E0IX54_ORYNI
MPRREASTSAASGGGSTGEIEEDELKHDGERSGLRRAEKAGETMAVADDDDDDDSGPRAQLLPRTPAGSQLLPRRSVLPHRRRPAPLPSPTPSSSSPALTS